MKAIKATPEGQLEIVEFTTENALEVLQEAVGGFFDCINLKRWGMSMWVHDEGKILNLPFNVFASMFYAMEFSSSDDVILGDVVFTGLPNSEGCTQGLTDKEVDNLFQIISGRKGK